MLTDEDKERIYQEEMYRFEIRAKLEKDSHSKTKEGEKIWTFLNSPFLLWFLSSVLLGIISFAYANWDKQKTHEREDRERLALIEREKTQTAKKLDYEISSRLGYFVTSQDIVLSEGESFGSSPGSDFGIENACLSEVGIKSLDDPNSTGYKINVYPEYANRNLHSLLLELSTVSPQEDNEIDTADRALKNSQPMFLKMIGTIKKSKKNREPICLAVDKSLDSNEAILLKKFCISFHRKRWGDPVKVKFKTQQIHLQ